MAYETRSGRPDGHTPAHRHAQPQYPPARDLAPPPDPASVTGLPDGAGSRWATEAMPLPADREPSPAYGPPAPDHHYQGGQVPRARTVPGERAATPVAEPVAPADLSGLPLVTPELINRYVRSDVGRRLRSMNWKHTSHAWDRRNRDPLGPHGLALFFLDPVLDTDDDEPARYWLRTAARLDPAGADVADLPRRIHAFSAGVRRYLADGASVLALMTRVEALSPHALLLGVGVSSLDTPNGPWDTVRQKVSDPMNIPGRCYAVLTDNTAMIVDRGGQEQFARLHVTCNAELAAPSNEWSWEQELEVRPDGAAVFERLHHLIRTLMAGEAA